MFLVEPRLLIKLLKETERVLKAMWKVKKPGDRLFEERLSLIVFYNGTESVHWTLLLPIFTLLKLLQKGSVRN